MLQYIRRNAHYALPANWKAGTKAVYRRVTKSGIFVSEDELGMCSLLPEQTLGVVLSAYHPSTVLDVGCGTGQSLAYFVDHGVEASGVEGSSLAASHSAHPGRIRVHDLRRPLDLGRTFDVVWCFEVAEHIHERHADTFVRTLARHGDTIVLSAAPPGQGGEGHFNEQPRAYWVEKMAHEGFHEDEPVSMRIRDTGEFFSENVMAFRRG